MKKAAFIAKTNLNTDGRILNQMDLLEIAHPELTIDFIILEDKKTYIDLGAKVTLHTIKTTFRNNALLRPITALEFGIKSFLKLARFKPDILHAQDSAILLPALWYKIYRGSSLNLIYDDHELPNSNKGFVNKLFNYLEIRIMNRSDSVIFANKERLNYLAHKYKLTTDKLTVFLNLPYFENKTFHLDAKEDELIKDLDRLSKLKYKLIFHQGSIKKERGRESLAAFSNKLPTRTKLVMLGISKKVFDDFIDEYNLNIDNFHFTGLVSYNSLLEFWSYADATIIMYLPDQINNRLCAPNRFYIALSKNIPVYVNKSNPVLSALLKEFECGYYVEDVIENNKVIDFELTEISNYDNSLYETLKKNQISNLLNAYKLKIPH